MPPIASAERGRRSETAAVSKTTIAAAEHYASINHPQPHSSAAACAGLAATACASPALCRGTRSPAPFSPPCRPCVSCSHRACPIPIRNWAMSKILDHRMSMRSSDGSAKGGPAAKMPNSQAPPNLRPGRGRIRTHSDAESPTQDYGEATSTEVQRGRRRFTKDARQQHLQDLADTNARQQAATCDSSSTP